MIDYVRTVAHATSVKELMVIKEPTATEYGIADFRYRPVFSVFDFGTIEPPVPLDNSTICLMQGFNFELLRDEGIDSHYMGVVDEDRGIIMPASIAIRSRLPLVTARVRFVNRLMPEFRDGKWDYSLFQDPSANNYVHPLELMSRNDLPEASSVWKRVREGQITFQDLGLPADFKPGDKIPDELIPILDYSTKFEPDDRYLSPEEARRAAGLTKERFAAINETTRRASKVMTDYAASRGFTRLDGKVEQITLNADGTQSDVLGDAVCTWHEDRLMTPYGMGISKQRIRDRIKKLNPEWYAEIQRAKKQAKEEGVEDFRTLMNPDVKYVSPSPDFFEAVNILFRAATNQWVGSLVYEVYPGKDEPTESNLERAVDEFKKVM